jgi:hypothetical protein
MKACQGLTVHHLRKKYTVLRCLPSLWTRSYFASTANKASQKLIQPHIAAAQKGV